ncbi:hypothetical protein VO178_02455 [Lysinibacillus fusiformis]|uniref:hypothetical protein n=1 Tax=Lysinibacillus fusiformis TaxID=28031 RepID=UPI002D76DC50|nr:hypothetical protein [Lysinibacillus fusiformis]WRS98596.1 hypothetical protein VO178_02455 [Lysinibacillus fusiformis]
MARHNKFNSEELKYIINQFVKEEKHKFMNLNFSNLAIYAEKELGLGGIAYYHFSRDKEINRLVKEYNKTLKSDYFINFDEQNSFTSLNIKEFVKLHGKSEERLTFYLSQLQESQKRLYDRTIKVELEKKVLEKELNEIKLKKDYYKSKNKVLIDNLNMLRERHSILAEALNREEEKQFLSALKYTNVLVNKGIDVDGYDEDIKDINKQKDLESFLKEYSDVFD